MIHGHSDVAKLSRDILSVSVTAESVLGKSKKSRKKNRWRPYHVVPARTFCKFNELPRSKLRGIFRVHITHRAYSSDQDKLWHDVTAYIRCCPDFSHNWQ